MSFSERRQAWAKLLQDRAAAHSAMLRPPAVIGVAVVEGEAKRLALISEADWQAQVEELLTVFKWKFYHTADSRNSEEGFPDLVALRPRRAIAAELKKMGEVPTDAQIAWLQYFAACGFETYVWRPADFDQVMGVLR